ncbi:transposase domain-containing protein [Escherichia coli]|uniref:transposase domain-containing protein n=1 Tax=Escherichia coli TaxID=562 RepID=UPI003EEB59BB
MKYNEYPCVMSYNPSHGYLASQYHRDPEQLRALAIAMVQKAMAESQNLANVVQEKDRNIAELYQNRIRILEEPMKLARQQRFGKKCESLAGMQRSLFEEDVDADIAALTAHLDKLLPKSTEEDEKAPRSRPIRKPLPVHLPRVGKNYPAGH